MTLNGHTPGNDEWQPQFTRVGDTFFYLWPSAKVIFIIDRIQETNGGVVAEVKVMKGEDPLSIQGRVHGPARYNLSVTRDRRELAALLANREKSGKTPGDWLFATEESFNQTIEHFREGYRYLYLGDVRRRKVDRWLMYNFLPAGETSMLYGAQGSSKSALALAIAAAVGGTRHLPFAMVPEEHQGSVLYLDWETTEYEHSERLAAYIGADAMRDCGVYYRRMSRALVDETVRVKQIIGEIEQYGRAPVKLLIVDSLAVATLGRVEDSELAIRTMNAVRDLGDQLTKLVVAHISKAELEKERISPTAIGSVMYTALSRMTWQTHLMKERSKDGLASVTLYNMKSNRGFQKPPVSLNVVYNADDLPIDIQSVEATSVPEIMEKLSLPVRIRELLKRMAGGVTIAELTLAMYPTLDPEDKEQRKEWDRITATVKTNLHRMPDAHQIPGHVTGGRGNQARWALKAHDDMGPESGAHYSEPKPDDVGGEGGGDAGRTSAATEVG